MGGEQISFEDIYRENYQLIYSYIYRMTRFNQHETEDLTQGVFLVAFQKWEAIREHPNIPGFLMQVAKNKLMKWSVKKNAVYVEDAETLDLLTESAGGNEEYDLTELYMSVEKTLSREQMEILRNYYLYGYSAKEMSDMLGIQENCFKTRISRMKSKLRNSLKILVILVGFTGGKF